MIKNYYELIIIGGGPAGLAAALGAKKAGLNSILIVERASRLGGVLYQCIHMGFGVQRFDRELTGPEYADLMIDLVLDAGTHILTDASVLRIGQDRQLAIASAEYGIISISAKAVILSTGCRERPIGTLPVAGTRPAGIFTAGSAQRMVNLKGYDIGKSIVILGSGDIGLIMARRLKLLGKEVLGVIEQYPYCTGLLRNKVQCLDDFAIPLLTGHTIVKVLGQERITGVEVSPVDQNLNPIIKKSFALNCDTLITSVGLIPETELLGNLNVKRDRYNIYVNGHMQTDLPWLFVCGNALFVHDLADNAADQAEKAGKAAAEFISGHKVEVSPENDCYAASPPDKLKANEIVCTVCPISCILRVAGQKVSGGQCKKGMEYAKGELIHPRRYLTATVRVKGYPDRRLPVRSFAPVAKEKFTEIMQEIKKTEVSPPLNPGAVIIDNVAETGINIIATARLQ